MNFRETLEKVRENKIDICMLVVADEVEAVFDELEPQAFETICDVVKRAYLKADVPLGNLVQETKDLLEDEEEPLTIEELEELDVWDLIMKASWRE